MSLKQFFLTLCLCAALIQVGLQCAKAEPPYEISLEDEFGNHLPTYAHRGEWFALGRDGQRYNVRVTNHTGRRVEAVVSVDGRDVLSGQPGDFKHQRGYLVPAYGSVLIEGFRTSLSEVAAFRFTSPDDSYSSRMGTPENVGVIGAAFFPEAQRRVARPVIPYPEHYSSDEYSRGDDRARSGGSGSSRHSSEGRAQRAPAAEAAPPAAGAPMPRSPSYDAEAYADKRDSNIGTAYGEQQYSQVSEVHFQRARPNSPERVLTLRYDDHDGLVARGILPRRRPRPVYSSGPEAFPVNRFAPPPPSRPYWY